MTAVTADPALPASQQLHAEQGEQTGDEIIQHDAEPAVDTAIEPGDGPGLEYVEQPEQHEAGQHPLPASRSGNHGDAEAYHLVPDDGTVIRHADGIGGRLTDANTRHEAHRQQGDEPGVGRPLTSR